MRNNTKFVMIILIVCIFFVGCTNTNNQKKKEATKVSEREKIKRPRNKDNILYSDAITGVEVVKETYTSESVNQFEGKPTVSIEYPIVQKLSDQEVEVKINSEIKKMIIAEWLEDEFYQSDDVLVDIDCEWAIRGTIISIRFEAVVIASRNVLGHPRFSLSYDLLSGKRLSLNDIYNIEQGSVDYIFDESRFLIDKKDERKSFMKDYGNNLQIALNEADTMFFNNDEGVKQPVYSYYTENDLILFVYNGHRVNSGGYYEIKIPYEGLTKFEK